MRTVMKKYSLFLAATLLLAAACQKQAIPAGPEGKTITFTTAGVTTRTEFGAKDGKKFPVLWNQGDKLSLLLASKNTADDEIVITPDVSGDRKGISFAATIPSLVENDAICVLSPSGSLKSLNSTNLTWNVEIPAVQNPLPGSPDPNGQILWARHAFSAVPDAIELDFKHFTAYGRISFKNLAIGEATVKAVSVSSDTNLVGRYFMYIGEVTTDSGEHVAGDFYPNVPGKSFTINTTSTDDVWFSCVPTEMGGHTLKFTVSTDKGTFTREVTVPAGKRFEAGKVTGIEVDMAGVPLVAPVVYRKVTDVSTLAAGDEVIICAHTTAEGAETPDYAMSTSQKGNNRQGVAVIVTNDEIVDPADNVERVTLEAGATAGTFYLHAEIKTGYLYAAATKKSSNNYLRTSEDGTDSNGAEIADFEVRRSWTISLLPEKDETSILSNLAISQPSWAVEIHFNATSLPSNPLISCYTSTNAAARPNLYKKVK